MKPPLYTRTHNYLAGHKKLALFLSHGGLHVAVLVLLIIATIVMSCELSQSAKNDPVIIDFEFGDMTHQSKLTNFNLLVLAGQKDNTQLNYMLKTAYHDARDGFSTNRPFVPFIKQKANRRTHFRAIDILVDSTTTKTLRGDFGVIRQASYLPCADSIIIDSSDYSRTLFSHKDSLAVNEISLSGGQTNKSWKKNPYYSISLRFRHEPSVLGDNRIIPQSTDNLQLTSTEPYKSQIKIVFNTNKYDTENPIGRLFCSACCSAQLSHSCST